MNGTESPERGECCYCTKTEGPMILTDDGRLAHRKCAQEAERRRRVRAGRERIQRGEIRSEDWR